MQYSDPGIHPYLPSLQPPWVKALGNPLHTYRDNVPHGSFATLSEFNWYDGKKPRFRHPYALYSAGHAELDLANAPIVDRMLFERDRDTTFLLADSGGFQIVKGVWKLDEMSSILPSVVKWQEAIADLAVVLEVPVWTKINGRQIEFEHALALSNSNLRDYARCSTGKVKFLNTLHGSDFGEACRWFETTKWFNEEGFAVGWCFCSAMSHNLHLALKVLLYMLDQGYQPEYLHILGQGSPQVAIVCDIMRRTVSRAYGSKNSKRKPLVVTSDSSSEFKSIGQFGTVYERAVEQKGAAIASAPFQIKASPFESADRSAFPAARTYPDVEGPILGKYDKGVVFGDILAPVGHNSLYNLDEVSLAILTAHNVWVKLDAIERLRKLESSLRRIAYAKRKEETYEVADILGRLMHSATAKGQISDLGDNLVATTVGLWSLFRYFDDEREVGNDTFDQRVAKLDMFEAEARSLYGKNTETLQKA